MREEESLYWKGLFIYLCFKQGVGNILSQKRGQGLCGVGLMRDPKVVIGVVDMSEEIQLFNEVDGRTEDKYTC